MTYENEAKVEVAHTDIAQKCCAEDASVTQKGVPRHKSPNLTWVNATYLRDYVSLNLSYRNVEPCTIQKVQDATFGT